MKLESVVAIAALEAAIKRLGITVAAKTLPISMAVELGHFLIESEFFGGVDVYDGTGAIDEFMFEYFKTLTDDAATADNAVNAFMKVLSDNTDITDIDVLHFYKSLADTADITDAHMYELGKPLTEDFAVSDTDSYVFDKEAGEHITNIVDTEYRAFYKALTEAPSLVDAIDTVAFFKNTQEEAGFTDDETLAFAKVLVDNVGATDDIDGAASILDDQEMQYHKITTDVAGVTDAFIRVVAYVRAYTDTADVTDDEVLHSGKSLFEIPQVNDAHSYSFNKSKTDSADITDIINKRDFGKSSNDIAELADDAVNETGKTLTDNTKTLDSAYVISNKVTEDTPKFTDSDSYNLGKLLQEITDVSDNLALQLLLAPFNDSPKFVDTSVIAPNKHILENSTEIADTGSLRSQSYSDFTYFAEDYVGASRNF